MLPETFQAVSLFNPIVYVISGFRWTFYGTGDVAIGVSVFALLAFLAACLLLVWWMFRTGYRLKS
jgi:ABC-2 type transport system permease protein